MAQIGGQIPEFWIDILQVPLEALAMQILPQVQSVLNAGDRHRTKHSCVRDTHQPGKHNIQPLPTSLWRVLEKLTKRDF